LCCNFLLYPMLWGDNNKIMRIHGGKVFGSSAGFEKQGIKQNRM